ncbi:MAG TPA: hypothetical protein VN634_02870 [Candidatus Limnocylindrales bacterium]|nr:hypothetical protein [Candidatus Limnocylindrales bacterium]
MGKKITGIVFGFVAVLVVVAGSADLSIAAGRPDGSTCHVSKSCRSGLCVRLQPQDKFGVCCAPDSCQSVGAQCGQISDGCGSLLDCGSCDTTSICVDSLCVTTTTTTTSTTTTSTTSTTTSTLELDCSASSGSNARPDGCPCDGNSDCCGVCGGSGATTICGGARKPGAPEICYGEDCRPRGSLSNDSPDGCPCLGNSDCCGVCGGSIDDPICGGITKPDAPQSCF